MKSPHSEPLHQRPRTMKEVCAHYGVSYRTMRKLMERAGMGRLARRRGTGSYYLQPWELRRIEAALESGQLEIDFGQ